MLEAHTACMIIGIAVLAVGVVAMLFLFMLGYVMGNLIGRREARKGM